MKLDFITITVRNLEDSLKFYTELCDLKEVRRITPPGGEIVFLANEEGETMFELASFEGAQYVETRSLTFSFHSENLDKTHQKASDLGYSPSEIICRPPKPEHFHVEDPDGITVEFI